MEVTWKEFLDICKQAKSAANMAVDWKKVSRTAAEILHVEVDDKWNKSIDNLKKRYSRYRTWLMN